MKPEEPELTQTQDETDSEEEGKGVDNIIIYVLGAIAAIAAEFISL